MRCVAIIPARYASTRLPGKPLADILGKPMIQHVYERVQSTIGLDDVVVATDDERIVQAVEAFGGKAIMTSPSHPCGTDRMVEVMHKVPADLYINVQGDEPLVNPAHITQLIAAMKATPEDAVGTLCHPITSEQADNPNTVKLVRDMMGRAMYFSRARIPFVRNADAPVQYLKHIGVYAYRAHVLAQYPQLPPSMLENAEMLEQLRLLEAGITIGVVQVDHAETGVDTPECLARVRAILAGQPDPALATAASTHSMVNNMANIQLVITDIDGVLTDGSIWYDETGECLKRFHVRDGMGIKMLQEVGVAVAVVSGRDSATLRKRMADLGITATLLGVKDKAQACHDLMAQHQCTPAQTAVLGDDSIDLPAFAACGWPVAVADAADYVKRHAKLVLSKAGGHGAFREFSDALLTARQQQSIFDSETGYSQVMARMVQ